MASSIDVFKLTRELIDIPSVTGDEFQIGTSLAELLNRFDYQVEVQEVEADRANVIATSGSPPRVVLSTHMDTVPPYIGSRFNFIESEIARVRQDAEIIDSFHRLIVRRQERWL